jgi:hypothetical protein
MAFPTPNMARVASALLRPHRPPREVYQTAGRNRDGGSGRYCVTYCVDTEAEGVELTTQEVEWMVAHHWLRRDPECHHLLYLAKGKARHD